MTLAALTDGDHTFRVRATDAAANLGAPVSVSWTVDTVAPDTAITGKPSDPSGNPTPSFSFAASEAPSTFQCKIDTGSFVACTSPFQTSSLADGTHTFSVQATDAAGNLDATPGAYTWSIDATPPPVTISSGPATPTKVTSASFVFSSTETTATFDCDLDGTGTVPCALSKNYSSLSEGQHTFTVFATDAVGNTSAGTVWTWTVDLTPPVTTITDKPSAHSNVAAPQFSFGADEPVSGFQCKVDAAAFGSCTSPFNAGSLADGGHTVQVKATDNAGNTNDAAPTSYAWTIDTTAPHATITRNPEALTSAQSARFEFASPDGTATFTCILDGVVRACSSPVTYAGPLADGAHTFGVTARDTAGNAEPSPATFAWTVDTLPPDTTITAAPSATSGTAVSFSFASSESGSTFQCARDGGAFAACTAPKQYSGLGVGTHTFSVFAVDALGHQDSTPAAYAWTVDPTKGPSVFMSPTGSDANDCVSPATACATFNGAFQKAVSGSIVELAGGTYSAGPTTTLGSPEFVIAERSAITSAVTFQPATGATVLLSSSLEIEASHVHVIGIKSIGTGDAAAGPDNSRVSLEVCANACATTLTDVDVEGFSGKAAFIRSSGVTIKGGEFGNYDPCLNDPTLGTASPGRNPEDIFRIQGGTTAASTPNNIVVDGTLIHDDDDHHDATGGCPNLGSAPRPHVDCLQAQGGTNITIENTVMWNCATANIQAQPFSGTTMSNWTIQNNFFGLVLHPGNSLVLGGGAAPSSCTTIVLRYNVIEGQQPNASGCASFNIGSIAAYGNIFLTDIASPSNNVVYSWNVFTPASTELVNGVANHDNKRCAVAFVDPAATGATGPNYHLLTSDACARGAGDPVNFPSTDIDGDARPSPSGGAPDAGADEIP